MAKTITIIADYDLQGLQRIARNATARNLMKRYLDEGCGTALVLKIDTSNICNYRNSTKRIPDIKEVCNYVALHGMDILEELQQDKKHRAEDYDFPWSIIVSAPLTFNQLYEKLNEETQAVLKPIAKANLKDAFITLLNEQTRDNVTTTDLDNFIPTVKSAIYEILDLPV